MVDTFARGVGRRVTALRREKGWNTTLLAGISGVAEGTIRNIESGRTDLRWLTAQQIAAALGTSVRALLPPRGVRGRR